SRNYFVPTHSLEVMEAAALREAMRQKIVEDRGPYIRSMDVLIQYLITLALSDAFRAEAGFTEIKGPFSSASVSDDEWVWILNFLTTGGESLRAYDEYRRLLIRDGVFRAANRSLAMKHRLSIGTIVGDTSLHVRYVSGKYLGTIEESFISRL